MMIYVTIRFEWDYALGCITALLHDVGIVLAVFSILRMEVNIELISVLLTIIGYSINNSIVVFDRVREMLKDVKKKPTAGMYKELVNKALDATIKMSINSSITTILPVIVLLVMGSRAIITFMGAMFIGLIAGTISSIFVAPTVWIWARDHFKPHEKKTKKKWEDKEHLDEYTIKGINA